MIDRLQKSLGIFSPPKIKKSNARGKTTEASDQTKVASPQDRADIALDKLRNPSDSKPKAPKKSTFHIIGTAAMLGLTGLGMFQGATAQTVPQVAPSVVSQEVQTTPTDTAPQTLSLMDDSPQMVVAGRQGQLLGPGKIVKFDQFPGLHREHLKETIPGAPNFRQVEGTNVYGVAQPTIEGLRGVLDRAGAKEKPVVWTNMREEPVVYINGRSHSLREEAHPFENSADFKGASAETVNKTEQQLKAEILAEAKANGGKILLHGETKDGVTSEWVEVGPESVKTTQEVYSQMQDEGYQVDYARIPVSDEKTPEAQDLQALVNRVTSTKEGSSLIFNCHAGRGRTTTAMVASQLIQNAQNPETSAQDFHRIDSVREDIKEQGKYERGDYRLILSLVKKLDNGVVAKSETDAIVDQTEDLQNLRTDINKYREKSLNAPTQSKAERAENKGLDYLHRYHTLISFNQYAKEQAPKGFEVTFEQWLEQKPEVTKMLKKFELAMNAPTAVPGQSHPGQSQYA